MKCPFCNCTTAPSYDKDFDLFSRPVGYSMRQHLIHSHKLHGPPGAPFYECPACSERFDTPAKLTKHFTDLQRDGTFAEHCVSAYAAGLFGKNKHSNKHSKDLGPYLNAIKARRTEQHAKGEDSSLQAAKKWLDENHPELTR